MAKAFPTAPPPDRWSLENQNDGYATVDGEGWINPRTLTKHLGQLKALPGVKAGIMQIAKVRIQVID